MPVEPIIVEERSDYFDRHPRPRHRYIARHREWPGTVGYGDTPEEVRDRLRDQIQVTWEAELNDA